ncbi:T9SS type A sorting domain-containing protein [Psychroserpens sp. SPM9]|uniref:T9SS type A sorting domain-containing protein n=1 Tax=Psychroserpens sp. SPM9 TaxID=2975598 RepID=UPI0021A87527|nr:T9SS type A sorting domain-containing protein [Psychroserpens sp. SPM9]MDG5493184.1 T9SS type A sorting domain-containing protein [Psychroserpens sp. SPM9]
MKNFTYICMVMLICIPLQSFYAFSNTSIPDVESQIQRVRINVTTPMGYTRHLLLGFTSDNAASDGFDYGYDALNADSYADDCNWMIEDNRYVIQGVGEFQQSKAYPLGLFLTNSGTVQFSLEALENFNQNVTVYIYDSINNQTHSISETSFMETISEGDHINRFYITFTNDISAMSFANTQLSVEDAIVNTPEIKYIASTKELLIKDTAHFKIQQITLYSILGQKIEQWNHIKPNTSGTLKVSLANISKGTYLVSVKTKAAKFNKRLIITK